LPTERRPLQSSDIASVGYDETAGTLEIEFRGTGVYRYFSVPRCVYDEMIRTPSPGRFFLQQIKGKYAWERASGEPS
jgi:hypothetical protein